MDGGYPISRYLNIKSASSPRFYSDGKHVAFLTNITGMPQVWKVKVGDEAYWPEQLTFEAERVQWVGTSPVAGNNMIIFGRDIGGNENAQLYLLDGPMETCITSGHTGARHIPGGWSKDGKTVLYGANRTDKQIFDIYRQPLDGEAELIWRNDDSGYPVGLTFSPDGGRVAFTRMEASFRHRLYEIDVDAREAEDLSLVEGWTRYSLLSYHGDGSLLLTTDVDSDFLYVARLDLASRKLERLVEAEWDVRGLSLSPDGRLLAYDVNVEGYSELYTLNLETGDTMKADLGEVPGVVSAAGFGDAPSFSPDSGSLAFAFTSSTRPMDVYVWNLKADEVRRVTRSSYGGLPEDSFGAPELVHFPTFDEDQNGGTRMIPSWFYKPKSFKEKRPPVIVYVHGGPEGQSRPSFMFTIQYFLNNGYAVFQPNVRGSTGYGKHYSHLDDVRKRMDSVTDLAHGAHWLKGREDVDGEKLVVYGGSYGGFMVLSSITTYPDLWVAAVDIVGISNLATFLRNTSDYRRKHRAAEYGSLEEDEEFLESIAPINYIEKVEAPLMVIQGANDPRVPLSESEQMVEALRRMGKPVEFHVFDDEGHGLVRLKNKLVAYPAMIEFLEKYLN